MGDAEETRDTKGGMGRRLEELRKGIREIEERRRNPTPREAVENKVLAASTREEVREAHEAIDEWLAEHPEDWYFFARGAGEQLFRIELALGRMSEEELVRHERRVIERREERARLLESGDRLGLLDHRGIRVPDAVRKRLEDRRNGSSS